MEEKYVKKKQKKRCTCSCLLFSSYALGYSEGHEHGQLHGTFEGRRIGTEKGFELWQDLGFMEGVAQFWLQALRQSTIKNEGSRKRTKLLQHLESLLHMIDELPVENVDTIDLGAATERIRAKYKLSCSLLNISPQMASDTDAHDSPSSSNSPPAQATPSTSIVVKGRRVDSTQLHF